MISKISKCLTVLFICIFGFQTNGQNVILNFDGNLEDSLGNYNPLTRGDITFQNEAQRTFVRLGPLSEIIFPKNLSSTAFTKNSFEISMDLKVENVDSILSECCWYGYSVLLGDNQHATFNLSINHEPNYGMLLSYGFSDGLDSWVGNSFTVQMDTSFEEWRNVRLIVDIEKRKWLAGLNNLSFSGFLPEDFDVNNFRDILLSEQIRIRGIDNSEINTGIYVDNFRFNSPAQIDHGKISTAFTQLTLELNEPGTLGSSEMVLHKDAIVKNIFMTDFEVIGPDLVSYTDAYEARYPPLYHDGVEYRFDELPILDQVLQVSQGYYFEDQFVSGNLDKVEGVIFEHAEVIPGKVSVETERKASATVTVNGTYHRDVAAELTDQELVIRPTGYYLAPGDIVTINVPSNIIDLGLSVIVGSHFRNMDYDYIQNINRFPDISVEYKLENEEIKLASPFGGGIYLKVPEGSNAGSFEMNIKNAIQSPYFSWKEGLKTDVQDWIKIVQESGAPWADFESDKFMFTVPSSEIKNIKNPDEIMTRWDKMMDAISYVGGRPNNRPRAEYYSFDTRLVTPAYGAGYPMIIPIQEAFRESDLYSWNPLLVLEQRPDPILLHEMGHNHLQPTMAYGGDLDPCHFLEAETIVHMLGVSIYSNVYGLSIDEALKESGVGQKFGFYQSAFDWIVTENFRTNDRMYEEQSSPLESKNQLQYQPRGWAKYADIAELFGWDALSSVNAQFYKAGLEQSSSVCSWRGFVVGRDAYIRAASEAIGVNMTPLFHFWGINPSDELAAELQSYPRSPKILARLLEYKEHVAPKTIDDFKIYHDSFPTEDYQFPRYEKYLMEFDEQFSQDILAQFDFLIETYFPALSTQAEFVSFSLPQETEPAIIDSLAREINLVVAPGTNLAALTPSFQLSLGARATIQEVLQISDTSVIDFSEPVIYSVLAEDNLTSVDWKVTVTEETTSNNLEELIDLTIFPNPNQGKVLLYFNNLGTVNIATFDIAGRLVHEQENIRSNNYRFELDGSSGIYILQFESDGMKQYFRLVKE